MLFIQAQSGIEARKKLIEAMLNEATPSSDAELLIEAPFVLRFDAPKSVIDWRHDDTALCDVVPASNERDALVNTLRAHYFARISQTKIAAVIELLQRNPYSKKAVLSFWEEGDMLRAAGSACIMYMWFRRCGENIDCHIHIRASDVYKKLLANIAIASQVHSEVASSLKLGIGFLFVISDCGHIYKIDKDATRLA